VDELAGPQNKNQHKTYATVHKGMRFETPPLFKFPLDQIYLCILHLLLRLASTTFKRTIEVNIDTQKKAYAINDLIKNMNIGCKKVGVRKTNGSKKKDTEPINFIGR
jgi:hypothetical protein